MITVTALGIESAALRERFEKRGECAGEPNARRLPAAFAKSHPAVW
jgi:hypothetical protein